MIYYLLRPIVRITFYFFYRKIYLFGKDSVPASGPLILTANHPTAFIEPCFLACFSGRTLYFITRGDIFINQWISWLLARIHLIPIYRFVDGYKGLRKNRLSLDKAKHLLGGGNAVLIMAEGRMGHEKFLRPIQKGAAKIGFEAMADYQLPELFIQPVGINYTYGHLARTDMMVEFAHPFPLSPYYELYKKNPKEAIALVTARIATDLQNCVIHINKNRDEHTAEKILQLVRNQSPSSFWPILIQNNRLLKLEMKAMAVLNQMDPVELQKLEEMLSDYSDLIKCYSITDRIVALEAYHEPGAHKRYYFIKGLKWIFLGFHTLPLSLATWITLKKVKTIEFRSSILMGSAMFLWLIYILLIVIIICGLTSWREMFIVLIVLIGTGFFWLWLDFKETSCRDSFNWHQLSQAEKSECSAKRRSLLTEWNRIQDRYLKG